MATIVVAGIGVAGLFGASSGAQSAGTPVLVSPSPLDVPDAAAGGRSLVISDDGAVIAYDTGSQTAPNRVVVRNRATATTELDIEAARPGLSGDGCTLTVSTTVDNGGVVTTELTAHDLCNGGTELPVASAGGAASTAAALSTDGSIVVWAGGGTVTRYVRDATGYTVDGSFTPSIPAGSVVGEVDVSSEGSVVVFEVTPPSGTATDGEVWVWSDDLGSAAPLAGSGSSRPTVSGDGRIVVFESSDTSLFPGATPTPVVPFVVAHDRDRDVAVVVAEEAWRPVVSTDGHHVAYRRAAGLDVAWWGAGDPFSTISTRSLGRTLLDTDVPSADAPLSAISAHGRWVGFDGDDGASLTTDSTDDVGTHVWVLEERPAGGGSDVDLGTVTTGSTVGTAVTLTNRSAAGAPLDGALVIDAPFSLVSTTCGPSTSTDVFVLQPGTSCTALVEATPTTTGSVSADVVYPVAGDPVVELTVGVTVRVIAPTTTTAAPTTTVAPTTSTPVASTVPQPTLPVGTAPSRPPVFTIPSNPGGGSSSFPTGGGSSSFPTGSSTGSSTGSTSFPTSTSTASISFEPTLLEFVPTIVDAGRRISTLDLVNSTTAAVSVTDVSIDPASAAPSSFLVEGDTCTGTALPPGARCTLEIAFAPDATGDLSAAVVATVADGSTARADLIGIGAESPVLQVVPGVASNGQVVSIVGVGFPAGATVEVSWDDGRVVETVEVSDVGDLRVGLLVLRHTPRGPTAVTVRGQPNLFADVSAELLVSSGSSRSNPAVRGGVGRPIRS